MQAQPAELPTPSLQALKQRAHQLLESQRSLQQQNQALTAECLGFENERVQQATQHQELTAERDALQAERDSLSVQLQALTAQRDSFQIERDCLQSERDQQATQHQELSAERDALQAERDSLTAQLQELTAQRDSIQQQWVTLQTTVEDLQGQVTAQSAQTAEQNQHREVLQTRAEELQVQLSAQREEFLSEQQDLAGKLETQIAHQEKTLLALERIFPCEKYRAVRPDLYELDRQNLVMHFIESEVDDGPTELMDDGASAKHLMMLEEKIDLLGAANALIVKERDEIAARLRYLQLGDKLIQSHNEKSNASESNLHDLEEPSDLLISHLTATSNSSDKWESYFNHYSRNLGKFKDLDKEIRVLEIGVQNGGSLEAWKHYLGERAIVIGTDIDAACSLINMPHSVHCYTGDATDESWVNQLCQAKGPFDIVIDDGSHLGSDIEKSFALFFPHILAGGIYICEDLHTAYWDEFGGSLPSKRENIMELFKEIVDLINLEHWHNQPNTQLSEQVPRLSGAKKLSKSLSSEVLMSIESIEFCNSMAFIRKCRAGMSALGPRIVSDGSASVCPDVLDADGQRPEAMGFS